MDFLKRIIKIVLMKGPLSEILRMNKKKGKKREKEASVDKCKGLLDN